MSAGRPGDPVADESPEIRPLELSGPGAKVTRLELFYDLVFVYAFLNVTMVTAARFTPTALLKGLLVLALLWFAWTSFVTLGNAIRADEGIVPLLGFATMAAVFVLAVVLPDAFGDAAPGVPGDLIFVACYLFVRLLQVVGFWYVGRLDPRSRAAWRLLAIPALGSSGLLLVAATVPAWLLDDGAEFVARVVLWLLAVGVEYAARVAIGTGRLNLVSAGHWADRHALIVLIALGESIISLGIGHGPQSRLPLTWSVIGASVLGMAVIAALWWAYFDALAIAAEQALHRTQGAARVALARDAYTYLHLPMIAGIILFALGLKRALTVIADHGHQPLGTIDRYVLYGGVLLYLLALLGFQIRTVRPRGRFHWGPLVPLVLLVLLILLPHRLPAVPGLLLLTLLIVSMLLVQGVRSRGPRRWLRRMRLAEQRELEAEETEYRRRHRGRWLPPS